MQYPVKCECGAPARLETISDETLGIEEFLFCKNPACKFYDAGEADRQQQIARQTKSYGRNQIKRVKATGLLARASRKQSNQTPHASMA